MDVKNRTFLLASHLCQVPSPPAFGGTARSVPNRSPTLTWQTAMVMSAVSAALRRTAPIGASRVAAVAGARQFRATPNPGEATPTARRCLEKTGS